jgi:hypothetical protein
MIWHSLSRRYTAFFSIEDLRRIVGVESQGFFFINFQMAEHEAE